MNDTLQNSLINHHSSKIFIDVLLQKILLGCLLFSISIFTVTGNLLVLYAIRTEKCLRTVSNLFILSLAFADLVVGILVMPLSAAHIIAGQWPFSSVLCQIWLSIDYVASTASIFNLVLLSLDRYWAVVYPLLYLRNRTRKRATNFIIIVWFMSFLWAPAVIFWSYIIPEHSDIIKPTECDTSFRSNKLFKTLTALLNFYLPLLTMIIISCRIMVAIRSRSTMKFGRRISSAAQKQMKQERTLTNTPFIRHENGTDNKKCLPSVEITRQPTSVSIVVNPFDSIIKNSDISSCQSDENIETSIDDNDSFWKFKSINKKRFRLSHIKPIAILFPSLSSIKENDKRKSEDLSGKNLHKKIMRNSSSVSTNMKYSYRQSNLKPLLRTLSTESSFSDDCSHTIYTNPIEQQISIPTETITIQTTTPRSSLSSSTHRENPRIISNKIQLDIPFKPANNSNKMTILTFFDYIINPSRSSSLQKELKAARQLGMLVGVFTVTWLPYFILFLVVAWCHNCVSDTVYTASIWLAYLNSTFNPIIYPLCNQHFRRAFRKTFYCLQAKTKLPNLNELHELHALHSIRHRK